MILNNAADIKRGSVQTDYVYHGDVLIWPPSTPPTPDWDKYETDYSDKIVIVKLDANGDETDDIEYSIAFDYALYYLAGRYDANPNDLFNVYYGDSVPMPVIGLWSLYIRSYFFSDGVVNKNNIKMFRYPRQIAEGYFSPLYDDYRGSKTYFTRLNEVVLPESLSDGTSIYVPGYFVKGSGVSSVHFRSDHITQIGSDAFAYCDDLKEIELPNIVSDTSFPMAHKAFRGCDSIKITLNNVQGSIDYEPWGATNATVIWKG